MNIHDVRHALTAARATLRSADHVVADLAYVVAGRLDSGGVPHDTLCKLKAELARYNRHTRTWKKP